VPGWALCDVVSVPTRFLQARWLPADQKTSASIPVANWRVPEKDKSGPADGTTAGKRSIYFASF